jgi:hypothetical protein
MDKEELLALQMGEMGELGYPFLHAIEGAYSNGADDKFVQDARALLTQLSGNPGESAIKCIKNAKKDLRSTETFLNNWKSHQTDDSYKELLDVVRRVFELLREFNHTIDSMSFGERIAVKWSARLGRAVRRMSSGWH